MKLARGKPVVWEVNSPTDESLARMRTSAQAFRGPSNPVLKRIKDTARDLNYRARVACESRLRRRHARQVSAAICMSNELAAYADGDLGIENCTVVPNGSDPVMFAARPSSFLEDYSDYFKVIYAGASQWFWQDVDIIDELAELVAERNDKIVFVVLDNSRKTSRSASHPNIVTMRRASYYEMTSYLSAADACLCLYHDFTWCRYGFYLSPLKLYDYMAAGKPIIASRLGQISRVIDDGKDGFLVTNDAKTILDKIRFCMNSRDQAKQIGTRAQSKIAERYTWRRTTEATVDVFNDIL